MGETISPVALEDNQDVSSFQRHSEPTAQSCFACSSRTGGIFSGLNQPGLVESDRLRQTSTYPAGVLVYSEAGRPRAAYCVCSGRLKLSCSSPDGRSVILGIAASGDVLGVRPLRLGSPHDHTAETLEESRICFVPKDSFLSFMGRNPDVSSKLSQKLSRELDQAYRQVCSLVLKPATERLAEVLLALCRTHGQPVPGGIGLKTNMCQDEMAEMVGLSRRSLNRALGTLRGQGLIECRRRFIIVRNHAALQNFRNGNRIHGRNLRAGVRSASPPEPPRNGPPSNSAAPARGTPCHAAFCATAAGSSATASRNRSRIWASKKCRRRHGQPGNGSPSTKSCCTGM